MPTETTQHDLEALLIRADAAASLVKRGEMDGLDALAEVLLPSPAMLEASYSVEPPDSVRRMAAWLMTKNLGRGEGRRKRRPSLPVRLRKPSRAVTLDELLATLS